MQPNEIHSILLNAKALSETEIQVFPFKTYQHPLYGEIKIDKEMATQFKTNFDAHVRGQDIAIDYSHREDKAKGDKAAGWYKELTVRDDGLYAKVKLTPTAEKEITDGEWRYFSPEYLSQWEHPETHQVHENVLIGGGLTNIPFLKGIAPINMSELWNESAPDEHTDPGLPHPGSQPPQDPIAPPAPTWPSEPSPNVPVGSVAYSYVGQPNNSQAKLTGYYTYTANSTNPWDWNQWKPNVVIPGVTFVPPTITLTKDGGDNTMDEKQLRELLGIEDDVDIDEYVKTLDKDAKLFRELETETDKSKKFEEDYPDEAKALRELRDFRSERAAKTFAERYQRNDNNKGLPPATLELIEEAAKTLSGQGQEKLAAILDKVMETGLVDYKEHGSSHSQDRTPATEAKFELRERIKELKEKDNLSTSDALRIIAKDDPELVRQYKEEVPQR